MYYVIEIGLYRVILIKFRIYLIKYFNWFVVNIWKKKFFKFFIISRFLYKDLWCNGLVYLLIVYLIRNERKIELLFIS